MGKRRHWLLLLLLAAGAAAVWPLGRQLTAESIARRSPEEAALAAGFLLVLYAVKGLTAALPLSALEAAGGLLFPLPLALGVNLAGVWLVQTLPFFLGRRQREGLSALAARHPRQAVLCRLPEDRPGRLVFLLRLAGASPGDLVSFYLGAAGVPWRSYAGAGLLGALPRMAAATVLGSALMAPGGPRFWLSLGAGGALTALSALLWLLWRPRWGG